MQDIQQEQRCTRAARRWVPAVGTWVLVVLGLCAWWSPLHAQKNVLQSDPLRARSKVVYDMLGGYMGLSMNTQGGSFTTNCNCTFTGGAGTGFMTGLQFESLTRSGFLWGVTLGYENRSIQGRFREIEASQITSASSGQTYVVPIEFLNTADVSLHFLTAMPYLKVNTVGPVFVRGGAAISYVMSSGMQHLKALQTTDLVLPNGESATVTLPDYPDGVATIQDGPIPNLNSLQLGFTAGVGLDLKVGESFFFSPVLQYYLPVTSISSAGEAYSTRAFQILVEGRWIL